jgi:hypothetical protein
MGPTESYFDANYVVEDVATGAAMTVVGDGHLPFDDSEGDGYTGMTAVGSQWVKGETNSLYGGWVFFLNWHTGELRTEGRQPPGGYSTFEDLDSTGLVQPICAPLKRSSETGIHRWGPLPFTYAAPLGAGVSETANEALGSLTLRKCGSRAGQALPGSEVRSLQSGGRVLSWIAADPHTGNNGDTMYVTRLEPHARRWHGRVYTLAHPAGADFTLLQHTATTVYETTAIPEHSIRIYAARIPASPAREIPWKTPPTPRMGPGFRARQGRSFRRLIRSRTDSTACQVLSARCVGRLG